MIHWDEGLKVITKIDSFLIYPRASENTAGEQARLSVLSEKMNYLNLILNQEKINHWHVSLNEEMKSPYVKKAIKFHREMREASGRRK